MKRVIAVLIILMFATACETVKLGALEQLGFEKRDVLVSRIEKARDAQLDAKEQFESALQEFQSVVKFNGGELEKTYNRLNEQYEVSKESAEDVTKRIDSVEYVAEKLFQEWGEELNQYSNPELKRKSQVQLYETRRQYAGLISAMRKAENSIKPVLTVFNDQVLFLKHNLNARAIASLKDELSGIESNVASLIQEMNLSIDEANRFIKNMES
ncbi:DUF2959 domain-containing protein [Kangiella sp. HZ709]|uniref:DUF2959 domain-containing protein n=1 Tax=Kangiella sp. HZ709 TaxID=2666328 RepID=UPI0012B11A5C|nr:DUF2959 domain-containing protein [Kangiella sp. HZ709]MRX27966.1 DUF2959 family protein [Kangiella sp. HZ709]